MASSVTVRTQATPRDLLAQLTKNHRLIKLFENLAEDVGSNIPSAMDQLQTDAQAARTLAVMVQAIASEALDIARQSIEVPALQSQPADSEHAPVQPAPVVESIAVNGIYINTDGVDPGIVLGYGTWTPFAAGQVLVGYSAGDPDFGTPGGTGGNKTITIDDHANHTHQVDCSVTVGTTAVATGTGATVNVVTSVTGNSVTSLGVSQTLTHTESGVSPIKTLPPYITVYVWKRTA